MKNPAAEWRWCVLCYTMLTAWPRNLTKKSFECRPCKNKTRISQVQMPYAAKLLFQDMVSLKFASLIYTKRSGISVR